MAVRAEPEPPDEAKFGVPPPLQEVKFTAALAGVLIRWKVPLTVMVVTRVHGPVDVGPLCSRKVIDTGVGGVTALATDVR